MAAVRGEAAGTVQEPVSPASRRANSAFVIAGLVPAISAQEGTVPDCRDGREQARP